MSDVERSLPPNPSLDQQRKLAKELAREVRAGDSEALARVRRHLPDKPRLTLADAQLVLAREYGFRSWAELKAHIGGAVSAPSDAESAFRAAVESRNPVRLRELLRTRADVRRLIDRPLFAFDSPALVALVASGRSDLVEALLEHGADPNRKSDWWAGGFHALYSATPDLAALLMRAGAEPDACAAAHLGDVDLLRRMLDQRPERVHERGGDGQTPLHFAADTAVADLLLERGADVDARDVDHRSTPAEWMLAGRRGAGRYELARHLVEQGATADVFMAAALGLADRVEALLAGDPGLLELRTGQGPYGPQGRSSHHIYYWTLGPNLSPLEVAARFEQEDVRAVIEARATVRDRFMAACGAGDGVEAARLAADHPRLLGELTPSDRRALATAAWNGDHAAVRVMLDMGFDPGVTGHEGGSALHCAAWKGSAASVRAILEGGSGRALVGVEDERFQSTPLGWCCHGAVNCRDSEADHVAVARLLLEAGAKAIALGDEAPAALREVMDARRR